MRRHRNFDRKALSDYVGRLVLTVLGLAMALPLTARPAQAHGGGEPQLVNAEAGPYRLSVWTQPDPTRVGEFHVTVAVSEPAGQGESGDLVLDATVRVQLEPVSQPGERLEAFATRENAVNKLFYEADLDLPTEGGWQVTVWVEGPAGAGHASFDIEALPSSAFKAILGLGASQAPSWLLWGGLGLAFVAAIWLLQAFHKGS